MSTLGMSMLEMSMLGMSMLEMSIQCVMYRSHWPWNLVARASRKSQKLVASCEWGARVNGLRKDLIPCLSTSW
jgi:hypothetical protein